LNALTGVVEAFGALTVAGQSVRLNRPIEARKSGLLRLFQTPQTYEELTCLENVLLSTSDRAMTGLVGSWIARPAMWRREKTRWAAASAALDRVGLGPVAGELAGLLPYGKKRLLDFARALAADPLVVMLDEPSAGLNQFETEELGQLCNELKREGLSLMVIDHKVDFIELISDRIAVIDLGSLVTVGPAEIVWSDSRVMQAYLGVTSSA